MGCHRDFEASCLGLGHFDWAGVERCAAILRDLSVGLNCDCWITAFLTLF